MVMRPIYIALLALLPAHAAHASMVTNLSEQPQTVVLEYFEGEERHVTIAPNETRFMGAGRGWVRKAEDEKRGRFAYERDHFTLWPDGDLHIQMRRGRRYGG